MEFYEANKKNCACIYKFTFPDGKCYVGRTKNLAKRIELLQEKFERRRKV